MPVVGVPHGAYRCVVVDAETYYPVLADIFLLKEGKRPRLTKKPTNVICIPHGETSFQFALRDPPLKKKLLLLLCSGAIAWRSELFTVVTSAALCSERLYR